MTTTRIDERSRRRPEFMGGVAVRLADGQDWHFASPGVRTRVLAGGAGPVVEPYWAIDGWPNFDADFAAALNRLRETTTPADRLVATLATAAALLVVNYDLTHAEAAAVIFPGDGPDAPRIVRDLSDAAVSRPIEAFRRVAAVVSPFRSVADYLAPLAPIN